MATSGGSVQPVSHGDSARAIHPDGAIRNATPIAIAACGVASTGANHVPARRAMALPCATAQKPTASATETTVAATPVTSVVASDVAKPGYAKSRRHGSSETVVPPIAGR